jgi:hypothetical protein
MRKPLLIAALILLLSPASRADTFTLIGTPDSAIGSLGAARIRAALSSRPGVLGISEVFSPSEQKALLGMGEENLAHTLKIELVSQEAALRLKRESAPLPLKLEQNSIAITTATDQEDPLESEQWGLINTGKPQGIYLDNVSTLFVPGVAGEDIGISRLPPDAPAPIRKVIVAVLDTGADYEHPDLAPILLRKESECQALSAYQACLRSGSRQACDAQYARTDTDGNGYPMDCIGWNLTAPKDPTSGILGDANADDPIGHGTHVAGIIAAALNGRGTRGVAENVSILPVRVIRTAPNQPIRPQADGADPNDGLPSPAEGQLRWSSGFADVLARGMLYAMRSGAQVINMSLAWPSGVDSELMRQMVALAEKRGVLVVAAAGNDSTESRVMPCSYPGVICVASHGPDGAFSHFSNYGSFVDIAAPGTRILSTWPVDKRSAYFTERDGYELKNGTSMSTPFVAGIAARMLGMGFGPDEIYARLIAGARPVRPSSYRGPELPEKYLRSGNVDLANALQIQPEPLILPASKSVVKLRWDRAARKLPFAFTLRDFWADAPLTEITARLVPSDARPGAIDAPGVSLETSHWTPRAWRSGTEQKLETALLLSSDEIEGKLLLEITARTGGAEDRSFRIPIDISVEVTPSFADPESRLLPIQGGVVSPRASLRTIKNLQTGAPQDYLALEQRGQDLYAAVLSSDGKGYRLGSMIQIAAQGDLLQAQKLDVDGDGVPELALLLRSPGPAGSPKPVFKFLFYDLGLKLLRAIEYDNGASVVSERFEWMKLGGHLTPAWVGFGLTPDLDKPAYDPWNPDWQDTPGNRFYYLTDEGVRMLPDPDDSFYVQLLSQTDEQRREGALPVLLARGDDYLMEYSVAIVRDGKLTDRRPLTLEGYRMLLGINDLGDLTPLDGSARSAGTTFTSESSQGARRITALVQSGATGPRAMHFMSRPPVVTDSVMGLYGAFSASASDATPIASFSESHYDLLFQDLRTGETAATTLGRFSYIPAFIFGKSFFPVVALDRARASRVPAILAPADIGESDGLEVILPSYDGAGKLQGLSRPARLRLEAGAGCEALGNPIDATSSAPSQAMFFCGDRFIAVPFTD